jgi:DNA-binding NtrC family response regulator
MAENSSHPLCGWSLAQALQRIIIIKKSRPRIPLIIISSGNSKEELVKVLEQGIFYFIMKPINGEELKRAVARALR